MQESRNATSRSAPERERRAPSLLWTPLSAIAAAAFAVELPFFWLGTPSGHDVEFHLYTWLEVLAHWKQGVIYPNWASLAHFGYGEPRFVFYPPASWTLGAVIAEIFPWTMASRIFIWIVLVLAGAAMFFLSRRWLNHRDATFAAVLYAVNPYHLVIVYWRSAFAELLASCLVPLLLLCLLRARDNDREKNVTHTLIPLALILAASWLINAPAAVMIHYSMALLLMIFAWQRKSWRLAIMGAAAVALAACLSAFYLIPAIYQQRWIEIANAVSPGSRPSDNFLFIHTTDADHDAFNRLISWVVVFEVVAAGIAFGAAQSWRKTTTWLWGSLLAWAIACSAMMFPITNLLWRILPKVAFMQFPWRWTLCLSMIFSLMVPLAFRRWWMRAAVCVIGLAVIVAAWHRVQAPWWDTAADLREMQDNIYTGAGYEGTDEYTPRGADPSQIDKDARKVTVNGPAHGAIRVHRWDEESRSFTAEMSQPDELALKLFRYPAWHVEVNGRSVEAHSRTGTGQMLVPVAAGMNHVQVTYARSWDQLAGDGISVFAWVGVGLYVLRQRRFRA